MVAADVTDAQRAAQNAQIRTFGLAARSLGLIVGVFCVALVALLSLRIGSIGITTRDAWDALFNYYPQSYEQTVVRSLRLPRTMIALGVGGRAGGRRARRCRR